jgi:hypothetical protein
LKCPDRYSRLISRHSQQLPPRTGVQTRADSSAQDAANWNAGITVHIGVIVSLAEERQKDETSFGRKYPRTGFLAGSARGRLEILGRSLLDRTIDKLRELPSASVRVIPEPPISTSLLPARSAKPSSFITAWEDAIAQHLQEGADQLLLLRVGSYSDLDYEDLLRFHRERAALLTQAYGTGGALDLAVVDAECLRAAESPFRKALSALIPEQERYYFDGHTNPLKDPHDLRRLVEDGLQGRCEFRPVGDEVSAGVWVGAGAHLHPSLRVEGPAFIGARSRIAENCTISGLSSVERDCELDCGTSVHQSCILQGVYVGIALDINRTIVSGKKLFHLDRNLQIDVDDERLIGVANAPLSAAATRGYSYA